MKIFTRKNIAYFNIFISIMILFLLLFTSINIKKIKRIDYPNNDINKKPLLQWRGHANTLYTNWLNYYVYQNTPYEMNRIKKELI